MTLDQKITVLSKELSRTDRRIQSIKAELIQTTNEFKLNQLADELVSETIAFNAGHEKLMKLYNRQMHPVLTIIRAITKK